MRAVFAVLFAALCFGTTGTSQALAGVDASPFAVGAARILIGGGILGVIALAVGAKAEDRRAPPPNDRRSASGPADWAIVLIGALGVLAYQPTFFAGASLSGVALGTVVGIGSAPVFTGVLDSLIRRRLPSLRWCLTTALALVGVLLLPIVLLAAIGLITGRMHFTLLHAVLGGAGLLTAVGASKLQLLSLGAEGVALWTGSGLALYWIAVLGLAAVGTTQAAFDADELDVAINDVWICRGGAVGEDRSRLHLAGPRAHGGSDRHTAPHSATIRTNDLSHGYVHENSAYST